MPHRVLRNSLSGKVLAVAAWAIAFALMHAPSSLAQRPAHPAGGGRPAAQRALPPAPAAVPQAQAPAPRMHSGTAHPHGAIGPGVHVAAVSTVRVGLRPIGGFRQPFLRGPFPRTRLAFGFNSFLWGCAPNWGWTYGCSQLPVFPSAYGSGFENYVTVQNYGNPSYLYLPEGHDLVWLYLKDGSAYAVTDYWFVNGEVHFNSVGEGGVLSAEQVIGADELDAQKTSEVNTVRGFRVVKRDAPWQKYLKDHPNDTPPPLMPQQN
jgi:hypothetical protein